MPETLPERRAEEPLSYWFRRCPCCDRISDCGDWVKNPEHEYVCQRCADDFDWLWSCDLCNELKAKEQGMTCKECKVQEDI